MAAYRRHRVYKFRRLFSQCFLYDFVEAVLNLLPANVQDASIGRGADPLWQWNYRDCDIDVGGGLTGNPRDHATMFRGLRAVRQHVKLPTSSAVLSKRRISLAAKLPIVCEVSPIRLVFAEGFCRVLRDDFRG